MGLAAISYDPVTVLADFSRRRAITFPLLSDAGNKVARQFRLTYRVPARQEAVYRRAFVNLPLANGDDSWELPIPATYIIDRDSAILYASANEDYTDRPEPSDLLNILQTAS